MALKFHLAILAILALVCLSSAAVGGRKEVRVGGYKDINATAPEVVDNAKFAIDEHNKVAHADLEYNTVVKAQIQVVSGINYKLVIRATDGGASSNSYEAIVWVKDWLKFKQLTSFKKLD